MSQTNKDPPNLAESRLLDWVTELEDKVSQLEGKVSQLEERFNGSTDWRPPASDLALQLLWETFRTAEGQRGEHCVPATGSLCDDLAGGSLRPATRAQLLDILAELAAEVGILVRDTEPPGSGLRRASQADRDRIAALLVAAYGPPSSPA